jgi:beta-galactosidase
MYVGVDYYPEHWPRSRWETDARYMKEAGFNVVRLAEFNWVNMEPSEGTFVFDHLDDALTVLTSQGIKAILCTPTAVMPAWVARKYPDIMHTRKDGTRDVWGARKNNCLTNPTYRLLSQRITRAMGSHYAGHDGVIGWQTDNEFGHPFCYCNLCRADFQDWLRGRYGSLDELNSTWGTHFWGHRLQQWSEITIPIDTGSHNPGACLDWHRYFSWQNTRFQREQVTILRELSGNRFITHNCMGFFPEINYFELSSDLDFVSWDNYPVWGKPYIRHNVSLAADLMRGVKKKNFWIMEQTAGPCGWGDFGRNVRPGELRNIAWQQVAHGADGMLWFRWRTCTAGREQYWHGLLGHDGVPGRRYREASQTAKEFHAVAAQLDGTTVRPDIAFIYDYDSKWVSRFQSSFKGNNYNRTMDRYYESIFRAGCNIDCIAATDDFSGYKLLFAPQLHVVSEDTQKRLDMFVKNGGVLVTDARSFVKDGANRCYDRTLPGAMSATLGISIEEYESIDEGVVYEVRGSGAFEGAFGATLYCDWITATTAQPLASFENPWHVKGFPVLTRNTYGKGTAYYLGAPVREDAFYDRLILEALKSAGIGPLVQPPQGVEFSVRKGNGKTLLFIINHSEEQRNVVVPAGKPELLSGTVTAGTLELDRFGVALLKLE